MSEASTKVRTMEPFGFWPDYASAIGGMGGHQGGPDPYYCFHTPYLEFEPGGLIFRLKLIGARATMGELALRVHAWKADNSMDAVLVGGLRVPLEGLEGDHEFAVRVASLPGVIYAFFGRYSQPSDLTIRDLELTAEELADEDVNTYATHDLTSTAFGAHNYATPSYLTILAEPTLRAPLSQPYSPRQLAEAAAGDLLPAEILAIGDEHQRWREAYVWRALQTHQMAEPGASGHLRVSPGSPLKGLLKQCGVLAHDGPSGTAVGLYDFLIDMAPFEGLEEGETSGRRLLARMTMLRKGGFGIFVFDAHIGGVARVDDAAPQEAGWRASEQEIQRLALRVIGHGSDIAQIAWPLQRDGIETVPFGLLVRR